MRCEPRRGAEATPLTCLIENIMAMEKAWGADSADEMAAEAFGGFVGFDYTQNNRPRVDLGNALVRCLAIC